MSFAPMQYNLPISQTTVMPMHALRPATLAWARQAGQNEPHDADVAVALPGHDRSNLFSSREVSEDAAAISNRPLGALLRLNASATDEAWAKSEMPYKWRYAATAHTAPVVILGTSCTAGSGADESRDIDIRASKAPLSMISNFRGSWARHLIDFLN
eukprot:6186246-Pleurochrysis_carterae.AAC.4